MSPLYSEPPYDYWDGWPQFIVFQSDAGVIADYLPHPLTADSGATMAMMISEFRASGFGPYNEATLYAVASFEGRARTAPRAKSSTFGVVSERYLGLGFPGTSFPGELGQ